MAVAAAVKWYPHAIETIGVSLTEKCGLIGTVVLCSPFDRGDVEAECSLDDNSSSENDRESLSDDTGSENSRMRVGVEQAVRSPEHS